MTLDEVLTTIDPILPEEWKCCHTWLPDETGQFWICASCGLKLASYMKRWPFGVGKPEERYGKLEQVVELADRLNLFWILTRRPNTVPRYAAKAAQPYSAQAYGHDDDPALALKKAIAAVMGLKWEEERKL